MTDQQLRRIRAEVGTSPDDDALTDLWDEINDVPETRRWAAVAAQVLGERLADQVAGSVSIGLPGGLSIAQSSSGNVTLLRAQVDRLSAIAGVTVGLTTGGRLQGPSYRGTSRRYLGGGTGWLRP
jgi:hypothetical protein